ncbi:iron ABC transporter substrate-binding protein [Desulfosporosinus meridiei]|uniref:ABC-type Fe3+-hydroxamate transport system, periplasmic component n=1 Tax=Desulfosporosinus meridiei (strain ATCC BAA-275 / DSM 13257 / KCTC 12902 / NCIMB 13706 / S10) TaxID=768704 RepID=J7IL70_DESMD|nr:iron ABC transporter substrate-binding protein [Desulfosporosinus meridiei]AFQ42542.1 ABC-type Fe3+-hydroxamate transport system, periplasmic component [Desulfosporosinus meridiei DSM 13257]
MSKKIIKDCARLLCLLLVGMALLGCSAGPGSNKAETDQPAVSAQGTVNSEMQTVTDLVGREVHVKIPAQRIVAVGPGSLRLVAYAEGTKGVVGIEDMEKKVPTGRPYMFAYPELKSLPTIGQGGIDTVPDEEALLSVKPDVIFIAYLVDKAKADNLQKKTGIPVVVLSYGPLATFNEKEIYQSLDLVGQIIGTQQRTAEVINYVKKSQLDLAERTKGIADADKPKVYVGGLGVKGTQGIESTQAKYPPFMNIGARSVVDETGKSGSLMIEREKLVSWDPDILFIDEGGYSKVLADAQKNPTFYQSLRAVKNGQVYGQIPYNFYTTNIDTALADAYYAGKVIFPEKFQDIDPVKKSEEIYTFLLGKPVYEEMAKDYGGFKKLDLTQP